MFLAVGKTCYENHSFNVNSHIFSARQNFKKTMMFQKNVKPIASEEC